MNALRLALPIAALLVAMAAGTPAQAGSGGGHGHGYGYGSSVRIHWGGPLWWGGWGPYGPGYGWSGGWGAYWPYGYVPSAVVVGPPAVVTSTSGVTYIEREGSVNSTTRQAPAAVPPPPSAAPGAIGEAPPPGAQWWYLCSNPRGAYPYVRDCPGGWERVPAQPPGTVR